jgi:hypothetical protein
MWKTAQFGKIALREREVMTALYHSSNNVGNGFSFVNVLSNFGIGFSYMLFILFPSRHTVSLLSDNPIVPFRFCFLAELMKENKRVMLLFPGLSI